MIRNGLITLDDEECIYDSYSFCKGNARRASLSTGYAYSTLIKRWNDIGLKPLGCEGKETFLGTCEDYVNLVRAERAKKKSLLIIIVE